MHAQEFGRYCGGRRHLVSHFLPSNLAEATLHSDPQDFGNELNDVQNLIFQDIHCKKKGNRNFVKSNCVGPWLLDVCPRSDCVVDVDSRMNLWSWAYKNEDHADKKCLDEVESASDSATCHNRHLADAYPEAAGHSTFARTHNKKYERSNASPIVKAKLFLERENCLFILKKN